jgi:Bacterial SH3 domain
MPTPLPSIRRPGPAAATAGVLIAAGAAVTMAVAVGTAAADTPGRCVTNVNVRAEPDITSSIVGRCQAGTAVQVGPERNGFVQLSELHGWAAADYVAVDGATPTPAPAPAGDAPTPPAPDTSDGTYTDENGTTVTPPRQKVVVNGVEQTPAEGDDARGIYNRTSRDNGSSTTTQTDG